MSKIVIAGGTGFLGQFLASRFRSEGNEVVILSRKAGNVHWGDQQGIINTLDRADVVINLAGKSVNCRYTEKNKREILQSRVETTRALGTAIAACPHPPKLWINSSTATIYRHAEDRPMTEAEGETGTGFSVQVAREWEQAFFGFALPQTRQIALRTAIVLGRGGALQPLKTLACLGLGGKQGSGRQMVSWIHIEDLYRIIRFLVEQEELEGVFNCSAPEPVTNASFMRSLRQALHRNIGLPAPAWLLEIGAVFIGTETELILKSRWVLPDRLQKRGFKFAYSSLQPALEQILC
ncbi:TIGR01777 family oxidoreductase [Paraflavisolibacter sp. H34]|uniref:TIGR01777 family oxidoreductase n=1 Tax=Huijunlia imazamoxiresistens TaxID=3127457 RepID=UPI003016E8E7